MDASRDEEKQLCYYNPIHICLQLRLHSVVLASMSRCICVQVSLQDMQCASKQKMSSQLVEFMKECVFYPPCMNLLTFLVFFHIIISQLQFFQYDAAVSSAHFIPASSIQLFGTKS